MLWDVISDEDIFTFVTPDIQSKIYNLFLNNIQGFFEVERKKTNSLVDLNKKYILLILNHIKKTYPYQPSKIKIHNEQPQLKELITFEEIQNDRKSQFEKDFNRRQEEFEDSMTLKAPPVPEFADKESDKPIKEMDKILKEMQAQRNYEVEQINRTYNTSNQVDNWLKPQETSLKTEKFESKQEQPQTYSRFKFLNEIEPNLSPTNPKKNVTFSNKDEINTFQEHDEEDINIFSKLKKVDKKEDNIVLQIHEQNTNGTNLNDDRIAKLERNVRNLNEKMDKIIALLSQKNLLLNYLLTNSLKTLLPVFSSISYVPT
jgi:hypothetical protein